MVRITASLIVRDEEARLGACLTHLTGIVDEIVVVDTGSCDRSPEIALAHGARLYLEPWQNDFSQARNTALAYSTGDWILYIDADERVVANEALHPVLANPAVVAARVRFRASPRLTPYPEYRLFRNRADIRFRGCIHETILPDIQTIVACGGGSIIDAPLAIDHYGYEGNLQLKHKRNISLLRQAVEDNPKRIYLWHALGECELGLGNVQAAERAWRLGLACVRQTAPRPGDALIYADLFDLHFADLGLVLPDIEALREEAVGRHPDDPLILWWTARQLTATGRFAEARKALTQLLSYSPEGPSPAELGYDKRLFNEFTWGLMGVCWLCEGEPRYALDWLSRAHAANPENPEIRLKRALAEAQL
ncbi:MAG: glycosyltransferase [Gammaproteobacteria bacterium]|nr:glycosyltransferase [Gammaproteobacteria bacterium]